MSNLTEKILSPLIERHRIKTFVESGCYKGDGIQTALDCGIKRIRSCDVWQENVKKCKERFKNKLSIQIFHCKGFDLLDSLEVYDNCIFWLDGHLPGHYGYAVEDPWQFPLIKELEIIKTFTKYNHVIMCDDAWLFKDHPNYIMSPEDYRQDITCKQIYDMFPDHHGILLNVDQGILLLEPL